MTAVKLCTEQYLHIGSSVFDMDLDDLEPYDLSWLDRDEVALPCIYHLSATKSQESGWKSGDIVISDQQINKCPA